MGLIGDKILKERGFLLDFYSSVAVLYQLVVSATMVKVLDFPLASQ